MSYFCLYLIRYNNDGHTCIIAPNDYEISLRMAMDKWMNIKNKPMEMSRIPLDRVITVGMPSHIRKIIQTIRGF